MRAIGYFRRLRTKLQWSGSPNYERRTADPEVTG